MTEENCLQAINYCNMTTPENKPSLNTLRFIGISILLFWSHALYAQTDSLASVITSLSASQKTILYQYAFLQHHAGAGQAAAYLQQNQAVLPGMSSALCNTVAEEIFVHSRLLYTPEKRSAIRMWMQAQTFTRWMLYLAAFIATLAVLRILYVYWDKITAFLIRQFAPLFRLLFSRFLLTIELLIIGLGCVVAGSYITDLVARTAVLHSGIFLTWSQCTALFTKEYLLADYSRQVGNTIRWGNRKEVFRTVFFPAGIVFAALVYIIYRVPGDSWYYYEAAIAALAAMYAIPFIKQLEYRLAPLLLPFQKNETEKQRRLAHYTMFTFILWLPAAGWLPGLLQPCAQCLLVLVNIALFVVSAKEQNRHNRANYAYLQAVTLAFIALVFLKGYRAGSGILVWQGVISTNIFLVIKYWELPALLFRWQWRKQNFWWGLLGMAALPWLLAQGTRMFLQHYPV